MKFDSVRSPLKCKKQFILYGLLEMDMRGFEFPCSVSFAATTTASARAMRLLKESMELNDIIVKGVLRGGSREAEACSLGVGTSRLGAELKFRVANEPNRL